MGESAGQGEGLNLGLSIGGCFMKSVAKEEEEEKEDERSNGFRGTYCRNKGDAGECWELRRKKELQALRRQNARRKCDQKRAKRAKGGDCEEESAPGLKEEEQKGSMIMTSGARRTDGGLPFVPMMQYVVQNGDKVQCIPVSVPYVFPCWPASSSSSSPRIRPALLSRDPMAVHGSGTVYQPIPCRSFAGDHRPGPQSSSAASSSSAVSENNNGGGSSSETRSHSQSEQCRQPTASSLSQSTSIDKAEVQSRTPSLRFVSAPSASKEMVAVDAGEEKERVVVAPPTSAAPSNDEIIIPANGKEEIAAPKGPPNGAAASVSTGGQKAGVPASLSSMPCVATTGDGPNGKTITGFLYRYTKSEVSIMCVCHGNSFSPAEFVKHAGRTDTGNPLRHIIVVPSPVG